MQGMSHLTFHHSVLLANYKRIGKLGEGNFSDVILIETSNKQQIALKRLKINIQDNPLNLLNEVKLLKSLDHPNIIKCYDYQKELIRISIALEYCDDGDLSQRIREASINNFYFDENLVLNWISQLFLAIEYLHQNHVLHRDLKPQNIFLMKNGLLKVGDFGIAKALQSDEDFAKTKLGTPYYLAPEICLGKAYSYPADIWMVGMVLYELMTLRKPFEEKSLHAVVNKIVSAELEGIKGDYSEDLKSLVREMLIKDPEKRITIKEILKISIVRDEVERLRERFSCYGRFEEAKNQGHQISFQEYLNDKLHNKDETPHNQNHDVMKFKESGTKGLMRYSSLPAQSFELYSDLRGNNSEENKNKRSGACQKSKENVPNSDPHKSTSHFEQFLESKKEELKSSNINSPTQIQFISSFEENFPFLKEMNLDPKFIDSIFAKRRLDKNEFFRKTNEFFGAKLDEKAVDAMFEHYNSKADLGEKD